MEYVELQPGSGNRRRRAVLASFALLLGGAMLWSRPSPTSPRVAAPELGAARQSRSRAGLSDSSWSDYAALLNESSGSIHISTDYAQCWTGYCTLNGDGLTASCGCLSVRPSGWRLVMASGSQLGPRSDLRLDYRSGSPSVMRSG